MSSNNEYRRRSDGAVITEEVLRSSVGNQMLPKIIDQATLLRLGYDPVMEGPPPIPTFEQKAVRDGVAPTPDGKWIKAWKLINLTPGQVNEKRAASVTQFEQYVIDRTQKRLDGFAHSRGYGQANGEGAILSACSYVASKNLQFAAEARTCLDIRDDTWTKLYQIQTAVLNATRPMPASYEEIEAEYPPLVWVDPPSGP